MLQGISILQQAAGVEPGLQSVTVAIIALWVIVELLQTAVATELHIQGLSITGGAVRIVYPCFWEVLHAYQRHTVMWGTESEDGVYQSPPAEALRPWEGPPLLLGTPGERTWI